MISIRGVARAVVVAAMVLYGDVRLFADTVYVSDFLSNTIVKFTPGGVGSVFANMGGTPAFIAAVPEPATLSLLVLGGLLALRRCRRWPIRP